MRILRAFVLAAAVASLAYALVDFDGAIYFHAAERLRVALAAGALTLAVLLTRRVPAR